jgi:putative membrane protein
MKADPIFNLRRCSGLSLFSCLTWFGFILLGSFISAVFKSSNVWVKLFLLGFLAVLTLRLLVLSTTSFASLGRVFVSSLLQPGLCIVPVVSVSSIIGYSLGFHLLLFLPLSPLIAVLTVSLFVFFVNRVGRESLGVDSLLVFRVFMANWTEDLNAPLESLLERFGHKHNVKLSLLAFRAKERIKAVMVVPALHPGPFKNVGSSQLPYMLQRALENKLQCTVSVPHGLSGHELDLTSQSQNRKIIESVLRSIDFSLFDSRATPFVRTRENEAGASCQIFGDCALLTLTLSPKTMEDLPQTLDNMIVDEAEKRGLSSAIVIDAHNCIEGPFDLNEVAASLRIAAVASLEQASAHTPSPFEIGAAKVIPEEFTVKEGMGPGGITVIVAGIGDQKTAYVTIDGNNMIAGLREKILSLLREIGIVDGEVLTTDTHMVSGVVLTPRGYHPIGEAMDQAKLINYVRQAAVRALDDLEPAEASWRTVTIPDVRVIGEKQIEALGLLAEKTAKQAKKLAISLFPATGALLTVLLMLL